MTQTIVAQIIMSHTFTLMYPAYRKNEQIFLVNSLKTSLVSVIYVAFTYISFDLDQDKKNTCVLHKAYLQNGNFKWTRITLKKLAFHLV